jgi:4-hydroxybenzoate polyprenyltransferase
MIKRYLRLLRPHQYIKNFFVFAGIFFSGAIYLNNILNALLTFCAFCLISSAVYIFNDICDFDEDKLHPQKKKRPIARGEISIISAKYLFIVLTVLSVLLGHFVNNYVSFFLGSYLIINILYSIKLKHVVILDVFVISTGFLLRIFAGTIGIGIPPSEWIILCGFMLTLFLGFAKRFSELKMISETNARIMLTRKVLDEYSPITLCLFMAITACSSIISYSVFCILVQPKQGLIYTVPMVVLCIFRYTYIVLEQNHGQDIAHDLLKDGFMILGIFLWLITYLIVRFY